MKLLLLASVSNIFTLYPGMINPERSIQMVTDKGLVLELVIACRPGEGIISYSKPEHAYCLPDATCYSTLRPAIRDLCN